MKKKTEKQIVKKKLDGFSVTPDTILGGRVGNLSGDRDYAAEVAKIPDDQRVEIVEFVSPATSNKGLQTIDRRGTTDEKLGMMLLDKKASDQQKLSMLSLYLFEKGKESASFIADLMLYKGQNTKETRQFKTQMRFDFEVFVSSFCSYLFDDAKATLEVLLPGQEVHAIEMEAYQYLLDAKKEGAEATLSSFAKKKLGEGASLSEIILLDKAIRCASEASTLKKKIDDLAQERERAAGKGIYLRPDGKAYKA